MDVYHVHRSQKWALLRTMTLVPEQVSALMEAVHPPLLGHMDWCKSMDHAEREMARHVVVLVMAAANHLVTRLSKKAYC